MPASRPGKAFLSGARKCRHSGRLLPADAGRCRTCVTSRVYADVARALGADETGDVERSDPISAVEAATHGRGADAVFEAVGIGATVAQSIAVARPGGQVTWIGNSAPEIGLPMQQLVTRELTIRGWYGFVDELEQATEALATGRIDAHRLTECVAPLEQGEELFRQLLAGTLSAVKVILTPNSAR